jgi:hypothetical protein
LEDDIPITAVMNEVLQGTGFFASDGSLRQVKIMGHSLGHGAAIKLYYEGSKIYCRTANNWRNNRAGAKHGIIIDLCDPDSFEKLRDVIGKCRRYGITLLCQQCPFWSI